MRKNLMLAAALCSALTAGAFDIVSNGKPKATVVLPENPGIYQKFAAEQLRHYVKMSTGAELPLMTEKEKIPVSGYFISVGETKMAQKAGVTTAGLDRNSGRMVVKNNCLFLLGVDRKPLEDHVEPGASSGVQGTCRVVMLFIRDFIGVRWFTPCPMGLVVPRSSGLQIPNNLNEIRRPAFSMPNIFTSLSLSLEEQVAACLMNNCGFWRRVKSFGGHTWTQVVPADKYFTDHPEYYIMDRDGKRVRLPGHLCTSNEAVSKMLCDALDQAFQDGYDAVQLGQSDGWTGCQCPECSKEDKHLTAGTVTADKPCEKIFSMHSKIICDLIKKYPDKQIQLMIYSPAAFPSKKYPFPYETNIIGHFCPESKETLKLWRDKGVKEFIIWMYHCYRELDPLVYSPLISPQWLKKEIQNDLAAGGVAGYSTSAQPSRPLGGPLDYVFARLSENPDADTGKYVAEYCDGLFGKAGGAAAQFFNFYYQNAGKIWEFRSAVSGSSYPAETAFFMALPPVTVQKLDDFLSKVEQLADTGRAKGFARALRISFDGLKLISYMLEAKRNYEMLHSKESLLELKTKVDAFESWRESSLLLWLKDKDFIQNFWPDYQQFAACLMSNGLAANLTVRDNFNKDIGLLSEGKKSFRGSAVGGHLDHAELTAPLTWNIDRMLANIGKKVKPPRIEAGFCWRKPENSGKPQSDSTWQYMSPVTLHPAAGADPDLPKTRVRAAYDYKNLYVLFECDDPEIGRLAAAPKGHDGDLRGLDRVELLLNPDAAPKKVMIFAASPCADAWYDARKGYLDDVAMLGAHEVTWNPKWSYSFDVDKEKKRWFLEMTIPFESVFSRAPAVDTVWTINFARFMRPVSGSKEEIVSSWTRDSSVDDPGVFGDIVFMPR